MKAVDIYHDIHEGIQYRLVDRDGIWTICKWTKAGWRKVPGTVGSELKWQAEVEMKSYAWEHNLTHNKLPEKFVR